MMNKLVISCVAAMGLLAAACGGDSDDEPLTESTQRSNLFDFSDISQAGSSVELRRYDDDDPRVEVDVTGTGLIEGNVYTLWWLIFNNDEACVSNPNDEDGIFRCGFDDFEIGQVEVTVQTFAYAFPGTDGGLVAPATGMATWPTKTYRTTDKEGLPGTDECPDCNNFGLTDVMGSEIHVLLRDHGPELDSADPMYESQFTTYLGACEEIDGPNVCANVQFAIFLPPERDPAVANCQGHACN